MLSIKKVCGFKGHSFMAIFVAFALVALSVFPMVSAIEPFGASVSVSQSPERAPADAAGNESAYAGNITGLDITGFSTTQSWQGYFGNVSGTVQLADSNDNVLYNWTLASPSGEVYATVNSTVTWPNVQCFNFTANGTGSGTVGETAGATNLGGVNLTTLETRYGLATDDVDGVNETFGFTITHDLFYTNNLEFAAGECLATASYDSTGASVDNNFEEVLQYEPTSGSVIFTSILEEAALTGFNSQDNDFQMLVLEDGHGADVSATTYFFYVELE